MEDNKLIRLSGIVPQSLVNGLGMRKVIFSQGCKHHCAGCFNPDTWSFKDGILYDMDVIIESIKEEKYLDGVTFSGGDPIEQTDKFLYLAKKLKKNNVNIWLYTGYTFEQLLEKSQTDKNLKELLNYLDVMVDGLFVEKFKTTKCKYRGSSNQRLINVPESLKQSKIIQIIL